MHFSKFLLGECMSNYFFSLSSFICYNFEFYLFDASWYWMLILYIYIKRCFIFLGRAFYFFFFILVSSTFLRSFILINTFSLPRVTSHRDKNKYCGNMISMKKIIWFSACHKMFATKPNIVNLLLMFGSVLSLHCCNPIFTSFCCLLIFHGRNSIKLEILITFSSIMFVLYCTATVCHLYGYLLRV